MSLDSPRAARPTRTRLFTPGPVEIPARVLRALSQIPPHHRTEEFRATLTRVTDALRELHGTAGEVFLLAASGTGAMEAAVVNLMSPGQKALAITGGKFGERWKGLLAAYGVPHETLEVEWGRSVEPAALARALDREAGITTVFATHSETSTGALHDAQALAGITRERGRRIVLDAVTSLGVHPLPQDAWGIDVVVCGSQKGLMVPPGIATVSLAPQAAGAIESGLPRFYFDLRKARKSMPLGETAFTPPVSLVLALEESLAMIREEGLDEVHRRHRRLAHAARAGALALGFKLYPASPSHAVTALIPPPGLEAPAVVKRLRERHGMVVAGGQDQLKGKILRIGHMGHYDLADLHALFGALEECVAELGRPASGSIAAATGGVGAGMKVLIADALDPAAVAKLRAAGHEAVVRTGLQGALLAEALAGADALLVRGATKVTAEVLRGAPSLKLVVRVGTGLDNIDVAAARERKVRVANTPAANAVSVAELVFGLLIALERHLAPAASDLRGGVWEKTKYLGRELAEKRIGIVGFGRIGREVAARAHAFGMVAAWCDPFVLQTPSGFQWARRTTLEEMLPESDYLSLHLPLNDDTRGLIGPGELAALKPTAVLVNCARGGLVDEGALFKALQAGGLRGAALDVYETEPPGRHPLLELPNVLATPHLGASTLEAQSRAALEAVEILIEAFGSAAS